MKLSKVWDAYASSVMGDVDRSAFEFNEPLTDDELLTLYCRNPRVAFGCDWIPKEACKNGITWESDKGKLPTEQIGGPNISYITKKGTSESTTQSNYFEMIHGWTKVSQAMAYCKLLGDAMILYLGDDPNLEKPLEKYTDFAVYHRLDGMNNGYRVLSIWKKGDLDYNGKVIPISKVGQPKECEIRVTTRLKGIADSTNGQVSTIFKVHPDRFILWKNPIRRLSYTGTPDSLKFAHYAQLEELLYRCLGKRGLNLAGNLWHFKNVRDQTHADNISEKFNHGLCDELYSQALEIDVISPKITGSSDEYVKLIKMIKDIIAAAVGVNADDVDKSEQNLIVSYAAVKEVQTHFKPYIEELFKKLGFIETNFSWNEPVNQVINPNLPIQNRDEYHEPGSRDQESKSNPDKQPSKPSDKRA